MNPTRFGLATGSMLRPGRPVKRRRRVGRWVLAALMVILGAGLASAPGVIKDQVARIKAMYKGTVGFYVPDTRFTVPVESGKFARVEVPVQNRSGMPAVVVIVPKSGVQQAQSDTIKLEAWEMGKASVEFTPQPDQTSVQFMLQLIPSRGETSDQGAKAQMGLETPITVYPKWTPIPGARS